MGLNVGYLTSDRTVNGDECYTPYYAIEPLLKYIPKSLKIWCPFDEEWSAFYQLFKNNGYDVVRSSLNERQDFFKYEPDDYDIIISNPPFSKKDDVLKRLYELDKPFIMLLPLTTLQGKKRFEYFNKGIQLLAFDKRINYHTSDFKKWKPGNSFASAYFCRNILPNDLIIEKLEEFQKPLI